MPGKGADEVANVLVPYGSRQFDEQSFPCSSFSMASAIRFVHSNFGGQLFYRWWIGKIAQQIKHGPIASYFFQRWQGGIINRAN